MKTREDTSIEAGSVANGMYANKTVGFTCAIPSGWVLRTDDLNAKSDQAPSQADPLNQQAATRDEKPGRVLLAAFSRPPEARGEDVNSSILIAAESMAAYPGLKEAAQYIDPVTEVAKARGFQPVEEPYEFAVGNKTLVRADFQKDVGTRVMRQSTLVLLARGYAVSFTFIAGNEDEVGELIAGLEFRQGSHPAPH